MKRYLLVLMVAFLPGVLHAQDHLHIQRIGLQGYFGTELPTPVRVHIPPITNAQTVRLDFVIQSGNAYSPIQWLETDRFSKSLTMRAGVPVDIDAPILFSAYARHSLRVVETDSQGREVGEDSRFIGSPTQTGRYDQQWVAIYCTDDTQCLDAQSQTYPIKRDEDDTAPRNDLGYIRLKELESSWLTYHAASVVVIAGPIAKMLPEQGKALEYYLRSGGTLVLVEKEAGNADFLAPYRQGEATLQPVRVGRGRIFRIPSLESNGLVKLFEKIQSIGTRRIFAPSSGYGSTTESAERILTATGTTFSFPPLRTLLIWIAVYILVIGVLNFAVLRWLRKLEWGWLTVSVTALIFAGGLYFSSSAGRPSHFTLDTATIYWMDQHSPVASAEMGFRITAPERKPVELSVEDGVSLLNSRGQHHENTSGAYLGSGITGNSEGVEGWDVQIAPPLRILTPMRRWSLEEFYAEGFHEFSGTVHWTSPTVLKNDTGVRFKDAMYVDLVERKVVPIPDMAPGQEVDLASIPSKPLRPPNSVYNGAFSGVDVFIPQRARERRTFSLHGFLMSGIYQLPTRRFFGGVVEQPQSIAGLDAAGTDQQNVVVAVVALDQP